MGCTPIHMIMKASCRKRLIRMYQFYNPNPKHKIVGDCVIRAISLALGESWDDTFSDISVKSFLQKDMPSSDAVWGSYLRNKGYRTRTLPDTCPDCYTLNDFCADHPRGTFIVKCPDHVVCVKDGTIFDTWDSSSQSPIYYYTKER